MIAAGEILNLPWLRTVVDARQRDWMLVILFELAILDAELAELVRSTAVQRAVARQDEHVLLSQGHRLDTLRYNEPLRNTLLEVQLKVRFALRVVALRLAPIVAAHDEALPI